MASDEIQNHANLIWGIAELLRGDYRQSEYGRVILPLVVMRRLDQALADTKQEVLEKAKRIDEAGIENTEPPLRQAAGQQFFNRSPLTFDRLLDDPGNIAQHLRRYIDGYSDLARQVIDKFEFDAHIDRLDRSNLLYQVIARVCEVDLHPDRVSNLEIGRSGFIFTSVRRPARRSIPNRPPGFARDQAVHSMSGLVTSGQRLPASNAFRRSRQAPALSGDGGVDVRREFGRESATWRASFERGDLPLASTRGRQARSSALSATSWHTDSRGFAALGL